MNFIDLFSGLGGFHHGLTRAGGFKCVFASEIDTDLRTLYYKNHGIIAQGDITKINEKSIPHHDLLCAGFPCQPFSLAGKKQGSKCLQSGKLINDILRITKHHLPKFILLENVPNILTIENGAFWNFLVDSFGKIGYKLAYKIMSPVDFGIPQNRKRIFILGCRNKTLLESFNWSDNTPVVEISSSTFLIQHSEIQKNLEPEKIKQLECWQTLLNNCKITRLPSLSLIASEFGATYPLNFQHIRLARMRQYHGAYGESLASCQTWDQLLSKLPAYAREHRKVREWIFQSVVHSRALYGKNKQFIEKWLCTLDKRFNSWQILEWRGYSKNLDLAEHLLQFRASGIRVSKRGRIPSFIAMTPTQIPIIGSEMRYISKREAASLLYLNNLTFMPDNDTKAFKALGNAVNAKIVEILGRNLQSLFT